MIVPTHIDGIASWQAVLVAENRVESAQDGRKARYYYHAKRWPWMMLVTQGHTLETMENKVCVLNYQGFERPWWNSREKPIYANGDRKMLFDAGPDHWRHGYYKVSLFVGSERTSRYRASEVLDVLQGLALGPFMTALATGVMPDGASAERLYEMLSASVINVAASAERVLCECSPAYRQVVTTRS